MILTPEQVKELRKVKWQNLEFFDAPCGPTEWVSILDTLEALWEVAEAAKLAVKQGANLEIHRHDPLEDALDALGDK